MATITDHNRNATWDIKNSQSSYHGRRNSSFARLPLVGVPLPLRIDESPIAFENRCYENSNRRGSDLSTTSGELRIYDFILAQKMKLAGLKSEVEWVDDAASRRARVQPCATPNTWNWDSSFITIVIVLLCTGFLIFGFFGLIIHFTLQMST